MSIKEFILTVIDLFDKKPEMISDAARRSLSTEKSARELISNINEDINNNEFYGDYSAVRRTHEVQTETAQ